MKYALEISWVKRLIQQQGARWTAIPSYEYQKFGGVTNVFKSIVGVKSFQGFDKICNRFWKNTIHTWLDKNSTERAHFSDIPPQFMEDESLWNNEYIC